MLGNAHHFLNWTDVQPAMVLHELAHAWHHQYLTYEYGPILDAYDRAVETGLYDRVEYADGSFREAYARVNHIEYFAELTEAWFWRNDFFPFVQLDVVMHDPLGARMVREAWMLPQ